MLKPHADVEPVENRHFSDASIGENAPQPGATISEGRQRCVLGSSDGIQAPADQHFDICIGLGDGAENLPPASLGFDVAAMIRNVKLNGQVGYWIGFR
jgi:hypothetical protein